MLRTCGISVADPSIVARTGWATDELLAGIHAARLARSYDLVTLLIGVNNQYRGRPIDEFQTQFCALLAHAVTYAASRASRVIVLSIPDWSVTPFAAGRNRKGISLDIDAFNAVARDETARAGARLLDITPVSRTASGDPALTASDGLHPSGVMYAEWARLALPVALQALGCLP